MLAAGAQGSKASQHSDQREQKYQPAKGDVMRDGGGGGTVVRSTLRIGSRKALMNAVPILQPSTAI